MAERSGTPEQRGLSRRRPRHADRLRLVVAAAVLVPLGLALKFYDGPGDAWVNNSVGGTAYVVFFCLVFAVLWPTRRAIAPIVISVLTATCTLETLQLWKPPLLQSIRSTFIGRTLIGTTFTPSDYVYYVTGAALGWLCLRLLGSRD